MKSCLGKISIFLHGKTEQILKNRQILKSNGPRKIKYMKDADFLRCYSNLFNCSRQQSFHWLRLFSISLDQ